MMTKEDYLKLSKDRLAELNVEKDLLLICSGGGYKDSGGNNSSFPFPTLNGIPCFAPGGYCTNPQMDCINCPRSHGGYTTTSTGTGDGLTSNIK